jgi:hypothetical protein
VNAESCHDDSVDLRPKRNGQEKGGVIGVALTAALGYLWAAS